MSIINEALKKASKESGGSQGSPAKESAIPSFLENKKSKINWGPILIVLTLLFVTGPIVGPMVTGFFHPRMDVHEGIVSTPAKLSGNQNAQFAVEEIPAQARLPIFPANNMGRAEFKLSGIVYSPEGSYCLINGQILKIGDRVGNARVANVTSESVTLDTGDQAITLSI